VIIKKTKIKGALIIKLIKNIDNRGYFENQFCGHVFKKNKLNSNYQQINKSFNKSKYTFRGMHYQTKPFEEIKIVQCVKGEVLDVIFDLRKNSKSFLKAQSFYLSEKKNEMLYIPEGVAHGYLTLTNNTELMYFHSNIYNKKSSIGINIMDNNVKFKLKKKIKIISSGDKKLKFLNDL
jgi:dTDP-4-dehydrorhamnose 3,5-epimerase